MVLLIPLKTVLKHILNSNKWLESSPKHWKVEAHICVTCKSISFVGFVYIPLKWKNMKNVNRSFSVPLYAIFILICAVYLAGSSPASLRTQEGLEFGLSIWVREKSVNCYSSTSEKQHIRFLSAVVNDADRVITTYTSFADLKEALLNGKSVSFTVVPAKCGLSTLPHSAQVSEQVMCVLSANQSEFLKVPETTNVLSQSLDHMLSKLKN